MALFACGLSHHSAPLVLRESLAMSDLRLNQLLKQLKATDAANEVVILSTCNRFEVIAQANAPEALLEQLAAYCDIDLGLLVPHWYCHHGQEAARHLMQVVSGVDSMVVGESQISGQVKQAFAMAKTAGTLGNQLHYLFERVLTVGKQVRSHTGIGASVVSVAYLVVELAKRFFADLSKLSVLVVGAGETAELACLHLQQRGVTDFTIASRSQLRGEQLASRLKSRHITIADTPKWLQLADMVVTATASQLPLLGKGMIETCMQKRAKKPLVLVDLAVPRDVEPEVSQVKGVYLFDMDDLQHMVAKNQKCRQKAAEEANKLIQIQAAHLSQALQSLSVSDAIKVFREQVERLCQLEVERAKKRLEKGESSDKVLDDLARLVSNKLTHRPSVLMKQAAYDGHESVLTLMKYLLNLKEETTH